MGTKAYYAAHREEARACARAYYETHREQKKIYDKAYREAHREERAAYAKAYREAHAEEMRVRWKAYREAYKPDPDKERERRHRRRARLSGNGGVHTAADIRAQYERQNGLCFWRAVNPDCAKKLNDDYHLDHVVPLALGGSNGPENLVLACAKCNLAKGAKHPMDFAGVLL